MSTLSKTLAAAAIAVPLLIGSHQANEAARLQTENHRLYTTAASLPPSEPSASTEVTRAKGQSGKAPPKDPSAAARASIHRYLEMAERGVYDQPMEYQLLEKGDRGLSEGAARAAGLSAKECEAVSGVLKASWSEASGDFVCRAMLVEEESDPDSGHFVYLIPARRDRGKEQRDRLLGDLENAVGITRVAILIRGFQGDDFLGGFGAMDVRIEFLPGGKRYSAEYLDPLTGEATSSGNHPLKWFRDEFGDSFEVPSPAAPDP